MIQIIFIILVCFQFKHFVADYPLQNRYMLGKFREDWSFIPALLAHVGVHGLGTFLICWLTCADWWLSLTLACLDMVIHFFMDRIKAGPRYLGRFKDVQSPAFWISLGFDQMVHHLTHYWIVYILVTQLFSEGLQ